MEQFIQQIDALVRADWLNTAVSVVIIVVVTALVARFVTRFLRRLLSYNEEKNLPSSSIFINITRAAVWILGISIMLSTSFNVNVNGLIAALGVGGIAISLGFQDTISNLIGGLQLSLLRVIKPGDHIEVGNEAGIVRDVTWRHTTIKNAAGEEIIVPNSVINKTALVQLPPPNQITIPIAVTTNGNNLSDVASVIEQTASVVAKDIGKVKKEPVVLFSEITEAGFKGSISLTIADSRNVSKVKDAVIRAVAPYTRPHAEANESKQAEQGQGQGQRQR